MKLVRCKMGHFYDSDKHNHCPHCDAKLNTIGIEKISRENFPNATCFIPTYIKEDVPKEPPIDFNVEFIVGWFICLKGKNYGQDYKIMEGVNYIGSSLEMDIVLEDNTISSEKHVMIVYDSISNDYIASSGNENQYYINNEPVYTPIQMKAYDILSIGNTELLFIPLCGEKFTWDQFLGEQNN